jgi:hypothetical protein
MQGNTCRPQRGTSRSTIRSAAFPEITRKATVRINCHTVRETNLGTTRMVPRKSRTNTPAVHNHDRRIAHHSPGLVGSITIIVGRRPTHVKELVEHRPHYQGLVDASKWGVEGVWFSGIASMIPIVWFLEWPQEIQHNFARPPKSQDN